ncbi:MAG: hypothetical protein ACFFAH_04695 [Promethearchaeota archaeon]
MERLIIVHWSKSTGPEPIIQYPPTQTPHFPSKELFLKIWALHELDKDSSIIEFIPEMEQEQYISIIHKFEGEIYFLVIVYDKKAKLEKIIKHYQGDILAIVSKNLIELVNTNKITRAISEAFYTIRDYSKLEKEENLLNFFKDKIKFTILQILRNGNISKADLNNILRKEYGFSTINIDLLLISFIRENLIVKQSVPGHKECYFLVKDIVCTRIPPKILTSSEIQDDIIEDYEEKLINFYMNYDCTSEIENKIVINFLMDKDNYRLLRELREKSLSVSECLDLLNNKEDLFNELMEKKIIYESKGRVFLFSDIRFIKFTPYYLIDKLIKRYKNKDISFDEYLTHLKLLTERYNINNSLIDYEII